MIGTSLVGLQVVLFGPASGNLPGKILFALTILLASLILASFFITRLIKKLLP